MIIKKSGKMIDPSEHGWGIVFPILLILLSVHTAEVHETAARNRPPSSSVIDEWAQQARNGLTAPLAKLNLPEEYKSVLSTITTGDKKKMPREVKRSFSAAGLAHILSVSGFHVAIICSFASILLSPLKRFKAGRLAKLLLTIITVWVFAAITGLAPPSVRAAIMLSFYLVGQYVNHSMDKYNTLFASAFCMLVYNPGYLFDVGFQLSYISVASILYFYPILRSMIRVINPLVAAPWEMICVSVAAQIGTSAICFYYFGQFSTVFLFANLPVGFLATILIPATIIWMILPEGFIIYDALQWMVEMLCRTIMWIVETFGNMPGATINIRFNLAAMLISYIFIALASAAIHIIRKAHARKVSEETAMKNKKRQQ
jgi:competence protein ComEC